jgi:Aspartyl/Asparaginyl beta-hydroxylase
MTPTHRILEDIDHQSLVDSYTAIADEIVWTEYGHKGRQTSVQYNEGDDPWTSSVGKSQGRERMYDRLNPYFAGTIFEELINRYRMTRTRFMWVGPYACYSMHSDYTPRIHVPIVTNSDCYFVFKDDPVFHLAPGHIHWVDTRKNHTFMNCSSDMRLHFVGIVDE